MRRAVSHEAARRASGEWHSAPCDVLLLVVAAEDDDGAKKLVEGRLSFHEEEGALRPFSGGRVLVWLPDILYQ